MVTHELKRRQLGDKMPSSYSLMSLEAKLEKAMPFLVAGLALVAILVVPIAMSNFHTIHTEGRRVN